MTLDASTLVRIQLECRAHRARMQQEKPRVSLVFSHHGVSCQVFLDWIQGKQLRDYIRDPCLTNKLSLNDAAHSRILDQKGLHRRLRHFPEPGDEFRFIHTRSP